MANSSLSAPILTNLVPSPWDNKSQDDKMASSQPKVPQNFIWQRDDLSQAKEKLNTVVIDLQGLFNGDELAIKKAAELIRVACSDHGFFHVINHGIDPKLFTEAYDHLDDFFKLPEDYKLKALKKPGSVFGFTRAHSDRFSTNLPWKETLSFPYYAKDTNSMVVDYFTSVMGNELEPMGKVYQNYCEAMTKLALSIMELLAISLGVERSYFKDFYEDAYSTLRCNYYPSCPEPSLVLGTGPHCDPTSLTILYQDEVGGLEVFANNKWKSVDPLPDALVINIGDTLTALTNGEYKSCLHRAVVNESKERKSIAFFMNPRFDKVVRPPGNLIDDDNNKPRKYPDFTWSDFLGFTQLHYRSDERTLQCFVDWFLASKTKCIA